MTTPATLDLSIYKGDSFDVFLRIKTRNPTTQVMEYKDLTGATVKAQVRTAKGAATADAEFTCTIQDQVATPGGVLLHLDPTQTSAMTLTKAGVWDCQVAFSATDVRTVLAGAVTLTQDVTV